MCLWLGACEIGGDGWLLSAGGFRADLPHVSAGEWTAAPCDSLDGAMCSTDGSLLCDGALEGDNGPAMCPSPGAR
jgi:hypothetical protein